MQGTRNIRSEKGFTPALGYNWLTHLYDVMVKLTMPEKKFRSQLIDLINPQPGDKILEFGFGTAKNIILLKQNMDKAEVQGIDIDPKIKLLAEKNLQRKNLKAGLLLYDGKTIPFDDNSFDKVFSCLVFHHLDTATKLHCLAELHRVLKPNGKLVIGDWGKPENRLMRSAFYLVQLVDGFKTTADNVKGLLLKYISVAGFRNIKEHTSLNTKIGTFSYYEAVKQM